jgi:hypothetical protein
MTTWSSPQALLKLALAVLGSISLLVYPLAIVWPSSLAAGRLSGDPWRDLAPCGATFRAPYDLAAEQPSKQPRTFALTRFRYAWRTACE